MRARVLLVDDDAVVLALHQRHLRSSFDVEAVDNGDTALELLEHDDAYAVVVADMHMPGMTGLELLIEAEKCAPHTVRMMLTAAEDQRTAADAVNSGHVFRFLHKPCRPDLFVETVREGVAIFERHRNEQELLEQTFNGIVQMLTGVLSSTQPESFGMGDRLRDRARLVGQAMKLPSTWEVETAAMLLRLGMATIPTHVQEKLRIHQTLSPTEQNLVSRIPEIGARLLDHIPRLAPVAEIIRHQGKSLAESASAAAKDAPIGARILRVLVDLQILEESGLNTSAALLRMRRDRHFYDDQVLRQAEVLFAEWHGPSEAEVQECMVEDLPAGQTLMADVLSDEGVSLIAEGTVITPVLIERLRNFAELGRVKEPLYISRTAETTEVP